MSIILSLADRVREHCLTRIAQLQVARISGKDVVRIFGTHTTFVLPWIGGLLTALVAAYVGSQFALRRSKAKRRWEKRVEAYDRIFTAVHDMLHWAEETGSSQLGLPAVDAETLKSLRSAFHKAKRSLSFYANVGGSIISTGGRELLVTMLREIWDEEHDFNEHVMEGDEDLRTVYVEHLDRLREIIGARLSGLQTQARADLR